MPTGSLQDPLIPISGQAAYLSPQISQSRINYQVFAADDGVLWCSTLQYTLCYDVLSSSAQSVLVTLGIQSCISWQSDPQDKLFVVDCAPEISSYRPLLGQKKHLYLSGSGPVISALHYKTILCISPSTRCTLDSKVCELNANCFNTYPSGNPGDIFWSMGPGCLPVSTWARNVAGVTAAWFLLSEYFWSSESGLRNASEWILTDEAPDHFIDNQLATNHQNNTSLNRIIWGWNWNWSSSWFLRLGKQRLHN